jgi:hypothetical protein
MLKQQSMGILFLDPSASLTLASVMTGKKGPRRELENCAE